MVIFICHHDNGLPTSPTRKVYGGLHCVKVVLCVVVNITDFFYDSCNSNYYFGFGTLLCLRRITVLSFKSFCLTNFVGVNFRLAYNNIYGSQRTGPYLHGHVNTPRDPYADTELRIPETIRQYTQFHGPPDYV